VVRGLTEPAEGRFFCVTKIVKAAFYCCFQSQRVFVAVFTSKNVY